MRFKKKKKLQEKRLAGQVAVVTEEIDRIKSEGEGAELQKCEDQLQRVKLENERLAVDLDKAKKVHPEFCNSSMDCNLWIEFIS